MNYNYYEILGLSRDATSSEVKSAYRKLSRNAHPDAGGNAALFDLISQAYRTLIDENERAAYDLDLNDNLKSNNASFTKQENTKQERSKGTGSSYRSPYDESSSGQHFEQKASQSTSRGFTGKRMPYAKDADNVKGKDSTGADSKTTKADAKEGSPYASTSTSFWYRVRVGLLTWAFLWVSDGLRFMFEKLSFGFGPPEFPSSLDQALFQGGVAFLLGFFLFVIFWKTRSLWRPFPFWEEALLIIALAVFFILGQIGFLLLLALTPLYLHFVSKRSPFSA